MARADRPGRRGCVVSEHAVPPVYPRATDEMSRRRRELAPEVHEAWDRFSSAVFADGALDERTKQLIAVAVAHVTAAMGQGEQEGDGPEADHDGGEHHRLG